MSSQECNYYPPGTVQMLFSVIVSDKQKRSAICSVCGLIIFRLHSHSTSAMNDMCDNMLYCRLRVRTQPHQEKRDRIVDARIYHWNR